MEPIPIELNGGVLIPAAGMEAATIPIGYDIGMHAFCFGAVSAIEVSHTYYVVHCRKCGLRITVPKRVCTYGDFREFMQSSLMVRGIIGQ